MYRQLAVLRAARVGFGGLRRLVFEPFPARLLLLAINFGTRFAQLGFVFLGFAFGLRYPRLPLFAVPCPTTLVTAGWLVTAADTPRMIGILPLAWAVTGSSAAFALGIRADFALTAAAVILAVDMVAPSALGARPVVT